MIGQRSDFLILEVFSNVNDSMIQCTATSVFSPISVICRDFGKYGSWGQRTCRKAYAKVPIRIIWQLSWRSTRAKEDHLLHSWGFFQKLDLLLPKGYKHTEWGGFTQQFRPIQLDNGNGNLIWFWAWFWFGALETLRVPRKCWCCWLQVLTVSMCWSHLAEVLCATALAAFIKAKVFLSSHKQRLVSQEDRNGRWNLPIWNHEF